jgi:hypothetical protein
MKLGFSIYQSGEHRWEVVHNFHHPVILNGEKIVGKTKQEVLSKIYSNYWTLLCIYT